jgi:hypothetical protein
MERSMPARAAVAVLAMTAAALMLAGTAAPALAGGGSRIAPPPGCQASC